MAILFWTTLALWAVTSFITKRLHKKHIAAIWAVNEVMRQASAVVMSIHMQEVSAAAGKSKQFKKYVHDRLDKFGVPEDPFPEQTKATGCHIEGRLTWLFNRVPNEN
jgi:CRISPR/Cas system endoribonuclease Cas6 (RAMP superfamily)